MRTYTQERGDALTLPDRNMNYTPPIHNPKGPFSEADLIITDKGTIYHLDIKPEHLAKRVVIVGDPNRVPTIANEQNFSEIVINHEHRGLRTITGLPQGSKEFVTLVTSGMGTPSLEIVLNELILLNEVDFNSRMRKEQFEPLSIIRVGTSGGLRKEIELGTSIITGYSVGLDNSAMFLDSGYDQDIIDLETQVDALIRANIPKNYRFRDKIHSYAAKSLPDVLGLLQDAAKEFHVKHETGITFSNSGFFANQGRDVLRMPLTVPDIDRVVSEIEHRGMRAFNMEMEASYLNTIGIGHGYQVGAICVAVANRFHNTFIKPPEVEQAVFDATRVALKALDSLK